MVILISKLQPWNIIFVTKRYRRARESSHSAHRDRVFIMHAEMGEGGQAYLVDLFYVR